MPNNVKRNIKAPCGFISAESGKLEYPAVDCAYACEACGWNPAEAKRRMEKGHFASILRELRFPPYRKENV